MAVIRHPKDFFAGLIFVAFGIAAIVIGSNYALGTAARMGPGYFPRILGILMIVLGTVVMFGLIVTHVGLVLSTIALIVLSSAASPEFRPKEAFISAILLAALAVGVFVIALKLQLQIWPWTSGILPWSS